MSTTSEAPATTRLPLLTPYVGVLDWADAYARFAERWLDWQCATWQPVFDAQAEFLRQWSERSGWTASQAVLLRGSEQLA